MPDRYRRTAVRAAWIVVLHAFAQAPQRNFASAKISDGQHGFDSVATQPVNPHNHDSVTGTRVVQ
jgi:hypothetical protein